MAGSILGSAVRRREDPRLVTGRGRYVDDVPAPGALHAAFARSPLAHATIKGIDAAAAADAVVLFPEHGSNLAFEVSTGNPEEGDPLEGAEVVVRRRMTNQRLVAVPMEGNAVLAVPGDGALTVYTSTQSPFQVRDAVAEALGLSEDRVRCIAPDVGGGFGAKIAVYPEQVVVAAAAQRLGRPVKWIETRSEGMLAMNQGRGHVQDVELGSRRDGTLVGLRARVTADGGAYPAQ